MRRSVTKDIVIHVLVVLISIILFLLLSFVLFYLCFVYKFRKIDNTFGKKFCFYCKLK